MNGRELKNQALTGPAESTIPAILNPKKLPPILAGRATPEATRQTTQFYLSVAELFEQWVQRRPSPHTQRAYRQDAIAFIRFLGRHWSEGFRWRA